RPHRGDRTARRCGGAPFRSGSHSDKNIRSVSVPALGVHPGLRQKGRGQFSHKERELSMSTMQRINDEERKLDIVRRREAAESVSRLADEADDSRQQLYD